MKKIGGLSFLEEKKLMKLKEKSEELKHKNKLKEIEAEKEAKREIEMLIYEHHKETMRIKTAEIRKHLDRKANLEFMREEFKDGKGN